MWLKTVSGDIVSMQGGFPARRSLAESATFLSQAPAGAPQVFQGYLQALQQTSTADDSAGSIDTALVDYFWFYRAIDRAVQGAALERELEVAQAITEQYLNCVQSSGAAAQCARQVNPDYQGFAQP